MMERDVIQKLLSINSRFYSRFANEFSDTRYQPQPGFFQMAEILPDQCQSLLDVGCGNGRLGRFLQTSHKVKSYTGVDSSERLLSIARENVKGEFHMRELSEANCLGKLGSYEVVCCLATLQHIPGIDNRKRLVREFVEHLNLEGIIFLSTWQFPDSQRQMRKVVDWSSVDVNSDDVENNDYLLTWGGNDSALRYVAHIDESEINTLAESAGLTVSAHFRSDGREGDLNLYSVLER
jgi:2-polyprenyl-3-methyl-5-hydroxy-6-metoxy-1,4-benzoquinol methylase